MYLLLLVIHVLLSAAWLGAMVYSLGVLHPRAKRYFAGRDDEFEGLIATLAQGARWKVLGLVAAIGATGLGLLVTAPRPVDGLLLAKVAAYTLAVGVFGYASWWLWPRRIFAVGDEVRWHQRRFRVVATVLVALVAVATALAAVRAHGG